MKKNVDKLEKDSIILFKLSSGEEIVTRLKGMQEYEGAVYAHIEKPLQILSQPIINETSGNISSFSMVFMPWFVVANDVNYEIPVIHIMCAKEPGEEMYNKYVEMTSGLIMNSKNKITI